MRRFKVIEHTADVGIVAYGKNLKELFSNTAYGMFNIIADINKITRDKLQIVNLKVEADNLEELMVAWLNDLLYQYNIKRVIFSRFKIEKLNEKMLLANIWGEELDLNKYEIKAEVKAATYHQLKIERRILKNKKIQWQTEVIFDV